MTTKVLLIVTSHDKLGDAGRKTGIYLPEFFYLYTILLQSHYMVDVASPNGKKAPIDPSSICEECMVYDTYLQDTRPLQDIDPKDYQAFVILGGHGAMWDLPYHKELQRILMSASIQQKIIAAIDHGSAALIGLKNIDGTPLIKGKKVTGFSNDEEAELRLSSVMPFLLEDKLKDAGALYSCAPKWHSHIIIDGHLVTGQNPASAHGVGEAVCKMIIRSEVQTTKVMS